VLQTTGSIPEGVAQSAGVAHRRMFTMMKKLFAASLSAMMVLLLSACLFSGLAETGGQVLDAIQRLEEDSNTRSTSTETSQPEDLSAPRIGKYRYMPLEALTTKTPGENEFTGKYYFTHVFAPEIWYRTGEAEIYFVRAYVNIEGNDNYDSISLIEVDSEAAWDDGDYDGYLVFFQYEGFSEEYGTAYGIYNSHEKAPQFYNPFNEN